MLFAARSSSTIAIVPEITMPASPAQTAVQPSLEALSEPSRMFPAGPGPKVCRVSRMMPRKASEPFTVERPTTAISAGIRERTAERPRARA